MQWKQGNPFKKRNASTLLCLYGDHTDDPSKLLVILRKFISPSLFRKSPTLLSIHFPCICSEQWEFRETSDIKRKGDEFPPDRKMVIRPLVFDATFALESQPVGRMYDSWSGEVIETVWIVKRRRMDNFLLVEFHLRPRDSQSGGLLEYFVFDVFIGTLSSSLALMCSRTNKRSFTALFPPSRIQCFLSLNFAHFFLALNCLAKVIGTIP